MSIQEVLAGLEEVPEEKRVEVLLAGIKDLLDKLLAHAEKQTAALEAALEDVTAKS